MSTPLLQARGRLAIATRYGREDDALAARRDLAAAKIEQYVSKVVADAPPLTDAQRARLARLLTSPGVAAE